MFIIFMTVIIVLGAYLYWKRETPEERLIRETVDEIVTYIESCAAVGYNVSKSEIEELIVDKLGNLAPESICEVVSLVIGKMSKGEFLG